MQKCPECGKFTFAYDRIKNRFVCLNLDCNNIEFMDPKKYKRENNVLQKIIA